MNATNFDPAPVARKASRPWVILAVIAAVVLLYLVLVERRREAPSGTEGPAIGRRLQFLTLEPLTGESQPVSLGDLQGHVTLVNFWGTWCPPCRREFPHIVELAAEFAGHSDFRLYAVSCPGGSEDDLAALRGETLAFLEAAKVNLPTYADPGAASRQALRFLLDDGQFPGYPTTLLIDRQGAIRGMWVGYETGAERSMSSLIKQALQDQTTSAKQASRADDPVR
ncbi:MAG TPA: TlpA disulfide reductase family protein [Pirellulales bacterium]|nr:TlpA disulfide reductase family protein [Pirellulales bacterium]